MSLQETLRPAASIDGGDLDCGSGLLLLIRNAVAAVAPGAVLEILSRESSVAQDLPAWCRMVGHEYLGAERAAVDTGHYLRKGAAPPPKTEREVGSDLLAARDYTWTARVRHTADMEATVYARNNTLVVGQPASFKEADRLPSAVEYLLAALGGDLANGFASHASRRGVLIDDLEVALAGRLDNVLVFLGVIGEQGAPGFAEISGSLYVSADADEAILREIWRITLQRSPIVNTLAHGVRLDLALRIVP